MKKIFSQQLLFFVLILLSAWSCSPDNNHTPNNEQISVLIVNEGNMSTGTASISAIMKDGSGQNDLFRTANNRPVGDVAQSLCVLGDKVFIALNNSAKIEVANLSDMKSVATISISGSSPRYITPISATQAVVSDYDYDAPCKQLHIINTKTFTLERSIDLGTTSQQMLVVGSKLFVATPDKVMVFNTTDMTKKSEIAATTVVGSRLTMDKNGKIWILEGGFDANWSMLLKQLTCIDPVNESVIKTIPLNLSQTSYDGNYVDINPAKDQLYFNSNKEIFAVNITDATAPSTPLFNYASSLTAIYNLTVSPQGTLFLCDGMDFSAQRGYVNEYTLAGVRLSSIQAGITPQFVHFLR